MRLLKGSPNSLLSVHRPQSLASMCLASDCGRASSGSFLDELGFLSRSFKAVLSVQRLVFISYCCVHFRIVCIAIDTTDSIDSGFGLAEAACRSCHRRTCSGSTSEAVRSGCVFHATDDVSPYETTFITSSPGTTKIPWWLKMCCEILT